MTAAARNKNRAKDTAADGAELMYRDNIIDHYRQPRNFGKIAGPTFSRRETNYSCGDDVEVFVKLDDSGRVSDAKFDGHGCAISQAATSMLTDRIKGMDKKRLSRLTADDVIGLLGIPVGAGRIRCATLGLKALLSGLKDGKRKKL